MRSGVFSASVFLTLPYSSLLFLTLPYSSLLFLTLPYSLFLVFCVACGPADKVTPADTNDDSMMVPKNIDIKFDIADRIAFTGIVERSALPVAKATVVMVPGTGRFDRDVYFGDGPDNANLLFLEISAKLLQSGFDVLRFEKTGVCVSEAKTSAFSAVEMPPRYWEVGPGDCLFKDGQIGTATAGALEVEAAIDFAHSVLPDQPVVVLAHSEGARSAAMAIENGSEIDGFLGIGALLESPQSVYKWQRVDRIPQGMRQLDSNDDDLLTNMEVRDGFDGSILSIFDLSNFMSATGQWSREDIEGVSDRWQKIYEKEKLGCSEELII